MNMVIGSETSNPLEDRGSGNAVKEQVVENCRIRGDSTVFAALAEVDRNLQSSSGGQHMQLHHNDAPLRSGDFWPLLWNRSGKDHPAPYREESKDHTQAEIQTGQEKGAELQVREYLPLEG